MNALVSKCGAEAFGTFALVFTGTGAIIVNNVSQGAITHVGISFTFGLIVLAMIYAIGDVSGCHINPAVTVGFYWSRQFDGHLVVPYVAAQLAGALVAGSTLSLMFPEQTNLGQTIPAQGYVQSFVMEFVLTLILMFVILSVSSAARRKDCWLV